MASRSRDISDTMGHKSTLVTETVYMRVIVPAIGGGATVMDDVFGEAADCADLANSQPRRRAHVFLAPRSLG